METHKRENNLKHDCFVCGASYARSYALKDHIKEAHPNVNPDEGNVIWITFFTCFVIEIWLNYLVYITRGN